MFRTNLINNQRLLACTEHSRLLLNYSKVNPYLISWLHYCCSVPGTNPVEGWGKRTIIVSPYTRGFVLNYVLKRRRSKQDEGYIK